MIIASPVGASLVDAATFADAARRRWGDAAEVVDDPAALGCDVTVRVHRSGEPWFTVDHREHSRSVHVDGTPEQEAEVAVWVRSLVPVDLAGGVIGFDPGCAWHVALEPGTTPERVWTERVRHSRPDDDPTAPGGPIGGRRRLVVLSLTGVTMLGATEFAAAAEAFFGANGTLVDDPAAENSDVTVHVTPPREGGFTVDHDVRGDCVRTDGTPEQAAAVAAWVRSLLPAGFPRIIACDPEWTGHVDLVHGITPDGVLSAWVSHDDPDWAAGDPDLS